MKIQREALDLLVRQVEHYNKYVEEDSTSMQNCVLELVGVVDQFRKIVDARMTELQMVEVLRRRKQGDEE